MLDIYRTILNPNPEKRLLAVLIDPDKIPESFNLLIEKICASPATHVFVGGSIVRSDKMDALIIALKKCNLPIVLFPGDPSQISKKANGILLLSLLSGRNPDYLIGHHVNAALTLKKSALEIIPTAYILIDGGTDSAVSRVSKTNPIPADNLSKIVATALAGEQLGNKVVYLEAGSGAKNRVSDEIISAVKSEISIPLIVGGGIRTVTAMQHAYNAGADMIVIGTAFEDNLNFFDHD